MKKIISAILTALLILVIPAVFIGYLTHSSSYQYMVTMDQSNVVKPLNMQVKAKTAILLFVQNKS